MKPLPTLKMINLFFLLFQYIWIICKTFFFSFFKLKLFQSATRHTRPKAFDFDGLLAPCVWLRGEGHVVGLARGGTLAAALLELLVVQFLQTTHERTKPPGAVPSRAADTSLYTDTADRHSRHATVAQRDRVLEMSCVVSIHIAYYCNIIQYNFSHNTVTLCGISVLHRTGD